ncbi:probable ATP-dependent RNA helicase DHX58 isoform X2 [Fukomys damarensis]|uniref:probable ATP-dependent RNA helicase DHX58 isoform X1 n=1 Tax=Fukomys damarensis TaxID=885580 RepID=UPI00054032D9|nr:probable ATP-dependent RNA helicase DHX58 isoform X1 [Fukomys damarensis]XP_010633798.1 probable ATP-dependent RNA helicase DHX58 isoform X2 [Fukomys damarensis]
MELRPYQWEVIMPALEGRNIIIWLPTGAGKTRAAAYVAKRHLETVDRAKVVVLVNRVHLVTQHAEEFGLMLGGRWAVATLSGDMGVRAGFGHVARSHDLLICTAELLQTALSSTEEEEHTELTAFSLIVVDECHHTHKDTVYNAILSRYLELKMHRQQPLPQVLGLTASPGTGGHAKLEGAIEHILQLCANLDTWCIMSPETYRSQLLEHRPQPCKKYHLCQRRSQDPFGDLIKKLMAQIHDRLEMPDLSQDFGTQMYEQHVVELCQTATEAGLQPRRVLALHLRRYNDALLIHDAVRAVDALASLRDFYDWERTTKTQVLHTERWLLALFDDHKDELARLATHGPENPKLDMLEQILQAQLGGPGSPRGIVFTRTRQSAHSLLLWLQQRPGLQAMDIRAQTLTGAGSSSQSVHMTQRDQQEVIRKFQVGALNLLVATSVAEEGLDIAKCNVVVRYGLLTNEISMVQARGRARANQSVYSFVATEGSRELRRELTNEALEALMEQAVATVQKMDPAEYQAKVGAGRGRCPGVSRSSDCTPSSPQIRDLQGAAAVKRAARASRRDSQRRQFLAEHVRLLCVNCMVAVGHGSDLRRVAGTHHVNVNPNFSIYYTVSREHVVIDRVFKDWKPGGTISCRHCGESWGLQMVYKSVTLPVLKVRSLLLETPQGRIQARKWSRVPFLVEDFDFLQHCAQSLQDLTLD